jgi:HPt (histidine-containing phosphotransfer) domain-containing protein
MDGYLSKPVMLADLKAMLDTWLPVLASGMHQAVGERITNVDAAPPNPAASGTMAKPVNISVLVALVGDDPATIHDLLLDFRSRAVVIATELSTACEAGAGGRASMLAHKLKSSARSVGALALGELCAEVEAAGKAGKIDALSALNVRFQSEMVRVEEALASMTASRRDRGHP